MTDLDRSLARRDIDPELLDVLLHAGRDQAQDAFAVLWGAPQQIDPAALIRRVLDLVNGRHPLRDLHALRIACGADTRPLRIVAPSLGISCMALCRRVNHMQDSIGLPRLSTQKSPPQRAALCAARKRRV